MPPQRFGAVNLAVPFVYYSKYAKVDEDDFGRLELVKEGFQASFGVFVTAWIIVYTYTHGTLPAPASPSP